MSRSIASRMKAVAPSATLAMSARAAELRSRGLDVYAFGVGEPDFEPPKHILDAAAKAVHQGVSKYTAVTGTVPLRKAICEVSERRRGYRLEPDQVCVSVGAKHALFNLALALYEPGDEVIIPAPYWVSYPEQVRMMGAQPVIVETDEAEGWKLSPQRLASALSPRTKAVILCTPSNPTGAAYDRDHMAALLDVLRGHDCWIIVDEIYAELVYDGFEHVSAPTIAPDLRDRIVVVDGVSKTYAMTGWRIGWLIAPRELIKAIDTVQGQSTTNPAAIAQQAALAALSGPQDEVRAFRDMFESRRNTIVDALNGVPGVRCRRPEGAFYAFADCRGLYGIDWNGKPLRTDEDIAFWLLEKAHVAAVPGGAFGAEGYLRFSYAVSAERIRDGIGSMARAVQEARPATKGR